MMRVPRRSRGPDGAAPLYRHGQDDDDGREHGDAAGLPRLLERGDIRIDPAFVTRLGLMGVGMIAFVMVVIDLAIAGIE